MTSRPVVRARNKPKKRTPVKTERRREPVVKKINPQRSIAPVDLVGAASASKSGQSADSLVLLVMSLAILCFAIAAVPWALVPWRPAYYVVPRQMDLTLLGFILLAAAGFTFVLLRGP